MQRTHTYQDAHMDARVRPGMFDVFFFLGSAATNQQYFYVSTGNICIFLSFCMSILLYFDWQNLHKTARYQIDNALQCIVNSIWGGYDEYFVRKKNGFAHRINTYSVFWMSHSLFLFFSVGLFSIQVSFGTLLICNFFLNTAYFGSAAPSSFFFPFFVLFAFFFVGLLSIQVSFGTLLICNFFLNTAYFGSAAPSAASASVIVQF